MITHIRGENLEQVIYAQGFAHAQTRLWNLEKIRRVSKGEIAELFGPELLPIDQFMRSLDIKGHATKEWENLPQYDRSLLIAYADGVNDYVAGVSLIGDQSTGKTLPLEFLAFGISQETFVPWHPVDTISIGRMISIKFDGNWFHDLFKETLRQQHKDLVDIVDELSPFNSDYFVEQMVTTVDDEDLKKQGLYSEESILEKYRANKERVEAAQPPLMHEFYSVTDLEPKSVSDTLQAFPKHVEDIGGPHGSNAWVISGKYTKSGFPLVASDPHQGGTMPSTYQLNELNWGDKYLIGAAFAGLPGIVIGRHNTLAWGITAAQLDTSDLWQEEINSDFTKYKLDGEWKDLTYREEQIKVKGQEPQIFKVYHTHRGPVIDFQTLRFNTQVLYAVKNPNFDLNPFYSLGWAKNEVVCSTVSTITAFWKAKDVHEVMANYDETGKNGYTGLSGNFHFGDTKGNIGYQLGGSVPVRKNKTPLIGSYVLDGTTSENDWEWGQIVPITELARSVNPEKGFLVSANNRQTSDNIRVDHSIANHSTPRVRRITQILEEGWQRSLKVVNMSHQREIEENAKQG